MRIQLLSDLHLESEAYTAEPAPGAELLVLAGDITSGWSGPGDALEPFGHWPVPVLLVAGNHEFDGRDVDAALTGLRARCATLGIRLLERETLLLTDAQGRRIRVLGTTRWCDFDVFGVAMRAHAMRAATYFANVMRAQRNGSVFGPEAVRAEGLACRQWLQAELAAAPAADRVLVITHFAPSLRSRDPRYGDQITTANFCNADDDLLRHADVWLHGHVHCRQDWWLKRGGHRTRVIANPRGYVRKGEPAGFDGQLVIEV